MSSIAAHFGGIYHLRYYNAKNPIAEAANLSRVHLANVLRDQLKTPMRVVSAPIQLSEGGDVYLAIDDAQGAEASAIRQHRLDAIKQKQPITDDFPQSLVEKALEANTVREIDVHYTLTPHLAKFLVYPPEEKVRTSA